MTISYSLEALQELSREQHNPALLPPEPQFLKESEASIAEIDKRFGVVLRKLNALTQQRKLLQEKFAFGKSLLAPIRRIPPEVLGEILSWFGSVDCLDSQHDCLSASSSRPALTFASVSLMWRSVALHIPQLWSNVGLTFAGGDLKTDPEHLNLLLERARLHPLSVCVRIPDYPNYREGLPPSLLSTVDRWKRLHLHFFRAHEAQSQTLSLDLDRPFPSLEVLRIQGHSPAVVPKLFVAAPRLRILHLMVTEVDRVPAQWGQISTLKLDYCTVNDVRFLLRSCIRLNLLAITAVRSSVAATNEVVWTSPIMSLSVGQCPAALIRDLFPFGTMPKLQALSLGIEQDFPIFHFSHFLRRSGCNILSVSLTPLGMPESEAVVMRVLGLFPAVEDVQCTLRTMTISLWTSLTPGLEGNPLLPRLTTLVLSTAVWGKTGHQLFKEFLLTRSRTLMTSTDDTRFRMLESVHLQVVPGRSMKMHVEELSQFTREGLEIVITDWKNNVLLC